MIRDFVVKCVSVVPVTMCKLAVTASVLFCACLATRPIIDTKLLEAVPADILVTMKEGTAHVIARFSAASSGGFADAGQKRTALYHALKSNAEVSQSAALDALRGLNGSLQVTSFWVTNQIHVRNVGREVLHLLATREEVLRIDLERRLPVWMENQAKVMKERAPAEPGSNIALTGVPKVWEEGVNGSGIVVGIVNTGVLHTHEALRQSYKNDNYSWMDAIEYLTTPYDELGHGTTHAGLVVGEGIGVAPGAKWMACKVAGIAKVTTESQVMTCMQFMLCPTHPDGTNPDCTKAPHIMSGGLNLLPSFTDDMGDRFDRLEQAMRAAGIFIVSSAGDYGFWGCSTLGVPAHFATVFTVGATNARDGLWGFSSKGPVPTDSSGQLIKPDITAPGVNVLSACGLSDNCYFRGSGTNRAAAQVAGVAALLLSMAPCLGVDRVGEILREKAERSLTFTGAECGGVPDSKFPNHRFGHGRVDALAVYECAMNSTCLGFEKCPPDVTIATTTAHWHIISLTGGGALCVAAVIFVHLLRRRLGRSQEPKDDQDTIGDIIQQFRAGVWPQMAALQEAFELESVSPPEHEIGNNIALREPYDLEQYEIPSACVSIDSDQELGSGHFGIVHQGVLEGGKPVAVKKLREGGDANSVTSFLKELQVMIYVGEHPNIVKLLGACTQSIYIDKMFIVLHLCPNGNLEKYLLLHRRVFVNQIGEDGAIDPRATQLDHVSQNSRYIHMSTSASSQVPPTPISTRDLLRWATEIAAGMELLALKKVIHGDLAARNVLLDENLVAKISDFGLASKLYEYSRYASFKTEEVPLPWRWMAPESLQDMKFSLASDVWAFGVTAWEVFALAEVPYPGLVWGRQFVDQLVGGYRNVQPRYATEQIHAICEQCWAHNPRQRPQMARVREMLADIYENTFSMTTKL